MNATGRTSLKTCMDSTQCQYGFWPCIEGL
jgi:hypothetical protein